MNNDEDAKSLIRIMPEGDFDYEVVDSFPDVTVPSDNVEWYLLVSGEIPKIGHMRIIWIDKNGRIRIKSMYLGNTTEWLEQSYGESGVIEGMKFNYDGVESAQQILSENFPLAVDRLSAFRRIVEQTANKNVIDLKLRCDGGEGGATFFLEDTIDIDGLNENQKMSLIRRNLDGLREAWDAIWDYEEDWLKRQGIC